MRMAFSSLAAGALVIAIVSCNPTGKNPSTEAAGQPQVRDSAGITIVENPGLDAKAEQWTLDSASVVTIGAEDQGPSYLLGQVRRVVFLPGGEILVTEANQSGSEWKTRDNLFRVFDAAGKFLRRFGGAGSGPGEFNSVDDVFVVKDSLWVYEPSSRRASVLDLHGRFGTMVTELPEPYEVIGRVPQGWIALFLDPRPNDILSMKRLYDTVSIVRVGDDRSTKTLLRLPGQQSDLVNTGVALIAVQMPLSGQPVLCVGDSSIFIGRRDSYRVEVMSFEGNLRRIIRRDLPNKLVTDEVIDDLESQRREKSPGSTDEHLDRATYPKTVPQLKSCVTDEAGNLWVEHYYDDFHGIRPTVVTWSVFSPNGVLRAVAEIEVPPDRTVAAIRSDRIALLSPETAQVFVYRIEKSPAQ